MPGLVALRFWRIGGLGRHCVRIVLGHGVASPHAARAGRPTFRLAQAITLARLPYRQAHEWRDYLSGSTPLPAARGLDTRVDGGSNPRLNAPSWTLEADEPGILLNCYLAGPAPPLDSHRLHRSIRGYGPSSSSGSPAIWPANQTCAARYPAALHLPCEFGLLPELMMSRSR